MVSVEQAYWQTEHHRAEKEEIKRQADVLKRWARLVKGLQIRRRLQAQYQRSETGVDLRGGTHDVNTKGKPTIVVEVSSVDLEPNSEMPGSHDIATSEAGGSRIEVRHAGGGCLSCCIGYVKLTLDSSVPCRYITIRTYSMQEGSSQPRTRSYNHSAFRDPSTGDSRIALPLHRPLTTTWRWFRIQKGSWTRSSQPRMGAIQQGLSKVKWDTRVGAMRHPRGQKPRTNQ